MLEQDRVPSPEGGRFWSRVAFRPRKVEGFRMFRRSCGARAGSVSPGGNFLPGLTSVRVSWFWAESAGGIGKLLAWGACYVWDRRLSRFDAALFRKRDAPRWPACCYAVRGHGLRFCESS